MIIPYDWVGPCGGMYIAYLELEDTVSVIRVVDDEEQEIPIKESVRTQIIDDFKWDCSADENFVRKALEEQAECGRFK